MWYVYFTVSGWWLQLWAYKHWAPSEVRTSVAKMDWVIWLASQLGEASWGEPGGLYWCYHSRMRVFLLRTHKHRIPSEENSQLWSWAGNCSIGDEPSDGQLPNWGWDLETQKYVFALWFSSKGFSSWKIHKLAVAQLRINLPNSSYPIGNESDGCEVGDEPFRCSFPTGDEP